MSPMTLSDRTAVVVGAHRPYPTLNFCLSGFLRIVDRQEDLIFVDNGSSASLGRSVSEMFPGITVINLSQNGLFCAGYNAGIRVALEKNYDFVLIVNADTEVVNDAFVSDLLAAAKRWPRAAFLGPLVYYRNLQTIQNTRLCFPSVARSIITWIPWRLSPGLLRHPTSCEEEVEYLNGVCVLCRCAALFDFGLMDERYGGYIEDADWSWRARKSGWSSVFVPVPSIIHHEEQEGYEHFSFKSFLLKRNTVLWFLKAGRRFSAFAYASASICLAWLRMLRTGNACARRQSWRFLRCLSRSCQSMIFGNRLICGSDPAISGEEKGLETWQ
jgi:N-acetylglucosaminyl-diphospho-decaprenol L-rhamnosyltransferase